MNLVLKFNVGLKPLLKQGLSELNSIVYNFRKIVGRNDFSDQFRKLIIRYKRTVYSMNVMRRTACLAINPIKVDNFAALFNWTPAGRASDVMMTPANKHSIKLVGAWCSVFGWAHLDFCYSSLAVEWHILFHLGVEYQFLCLLFWYISAIHMRKSDTRMYL